MSGGLNKEPRRKREEEPQNPDRREAIKIGLGALAAGGLTVGGVKLGETLLGPYLNQLREAEEKERALTHKGKALVLKKMDKVSTPPTARDIIGGGVNQLGYGILPAIIEAGRIAAGKEPMDTIPKDFWLIKIDEREPEVIPLSPQISKRIERGDELPIEYVTSEDGKEIAKIKSLEPVR